MNAVLPGVLAAAAAASTVAAVRRIDIGGRHRRDLRRRLVERTRVGRELRDSLGRAGIGLGPEAFLLVTAGAAMTLGTVGWLILGSPVAAIMLALGVAGAARAFVASSDERYLARIGAQLPVVAQQLGSAIGAGASLRQAIARAARDAPEPAATELGRIERDLELGAPVDTAIEAAVEGLPQPQFRAMMSAILVQRIVGGNLAGALTRLSAQLEERAALEREARGATAQARMSAWLVAGLPFGGGMLVEIVAPGTLARTLGGGLGLALLVVATGLELMGVALIRRLVRERP